MLAREDQRRANFQDIRVSASRPDQHAARAQGVDHSMGLRGGWREAWRRGRDITIDQLNADE
jgi:hypothetical protein